ncbi:MAG: fibronectin type III domain-containing protein [Planctomycetota bacterium]|nr:fibronectin type III domain-containing protein [Planctomycetota bacterium]
MLKTGYNNLIIFVFLLLSLLSFLSPGCLGLGKGSDDDTTSGSSGLIPITPTQLTVRAISDSEIVLSWDDNSTTEIGFYVERSPITPATYSKIATLPANRTVYTDTGRSPNSIYYYRVQAYNYAGNSNYSNEKSATTQNVGVRLDTWSPITTTAGPSARIGHTALYVDGYGMLIYGGGDFLRDGGVYSPTIQAWSQQITTTNAPSARVGHTAVWTGSEMLVWGGEIPVPIVIEWSDPPTNSVPSLYRVTTMDGARYNPATNSWQLITTVNAPEDRINHTAIWIGSKMIIWGGDRIRRNVTGEITRTKLNTGGIYDPVGDTWSPYHPNLNSGFGAPSARRYHSAVWTGGVMLVWGGDGGGNSGGMYSPTTDYWITEPIAIQNAPSARYGHTTIWTGAGSEPWLNKMIVWGGTDGEAYFNTGGIYDPVSNTWTALPTTNTPSGRVWHSVVWTGSKMIIWGGGAGVLTGAFNDGGVYNPVRNVWESLPASSALTARTRHTAVWNNINQILIWGGWDAFATFNDGGVYTTD